MTPRTALGRVRGVLDRAGNIEESGRIACPACDMGELFMLTNGAGRVGLECSAGCSASHVGDVLLDLAALFAVPLSPVDLADAGGNDR